MNLTEGTKLGRYEIRSLIGAGGMGEVYLAEDTRLNRQVALKMLPSNAVQNADNLRRFEQEAKAASRLNHPSIAHIYEIGESEGLHFIAMEYVEGESLSDRINSRQLSAFEIVEIGAQIADALEEAHSQGIVHRDIKSQNVMLNQRGRVKVLDFGLAKVSQKIESEESTRVKTAPGVVMGTVAYMSPEQALGRETDARTDIWSLGVILYEMATGHLPFQGESLTETIDKIAHSQPVAVARFNYEVPAELEIIIKKALRKKREERYQSAKDLLVDLQNLKRELELTEHYVQPEQSVEGKFSSGSHEQPTQNLTRKQPVETNEAATIQTTSSAEYIFTEIKRHKTGAIIASVILLLAISGLGYGLYRLFQNRTEQTNQTSKPAPNLKTQRLTGDGKTTQAAISPDGKFLANARNEAGQTSLWVKQISTNSNVQIVSPGVMDEFRIPTFTPDGSFVYFWGKNAENLKGAILRVPVLGGPVSKVVADAGSFSFSPDGKQIVFNRWNSNTNESSLIIASSEGAGERKLASRSGNQWFSSNPSWSPDGKLIACGAADNQLPESKHAVAVIGVPDGAVKELTTAKWEFIYDLAWLPDMSGVVFMGTETGGSQGVSQLWEASHPSGEARRLTQNLISYGGISLTADGKTLVTVERDFNASVWVSPNADLGQARQITTGKGAYGRGIAWTPDGRIVYISTASGIEEVWVMNADGAGAKQLTNDRRIKFTPDVSPDGRYVVYAAMEKGFIRLWRVEIGGGNPVQLTNSKDNQDPEISPDGKWIVYSNYDSGKGEIWRVSVEGGEAKKLTDLYFASDPAISPDGKYISCFYWDEKEVMRIAVIPFEGGAPVKTFDVPQTADWDLNAVWTPDGRGLTYLDVRGNVGNLWLQPIEGGAPKQLTDFKQNGISRREWTRDGKRVAIVRGDSTSDAVIITDFR